MKQNYLIYKDLKMITKMGLNAEQETLTLLEHLISPVVCKEFMLSCNLFSLFSVRRLSYEYGFIDCMILLIICYISHQRKNHFTMTTTIT